MGSKIIRNVLVGLNFFLSYDLSSGDNYTLPKKLIPTISPLNNSFWTDWYISHLMKIKIPARSKANVFVYWKGGNLRCDWSIKPRARLYLTQLDLYLEDYDEQTNIKDIYICSPSIITNTDYSNEIIGTSTRPKSKENLSKSGGTHLLLTYSKLPNEFVDSILLDDAGEKEPIRRIKQFLTGINGWDKFWPFDFEYFVIAWERDANGTTDLYVYVKLCKWERRINLHTFDIWNGSSWSHPNIQCSKSIPNEKLDCVLKEGNFIADSSIIIIKGDDTGYNYYTIELYVRHLAETVGVNAAGEFYWQNDLDGYLLKWPKLIRKLEKLRWNFVRKMVESKARQKHGDKAEEYLKRNGWRD